MRLLAVIAILAILSGCAVQQPAAVAANCDIAAPPPQSGEAPVQGYVAKVFPRRKDFPAQYTGCQTLWAPPEEDHRRLAVIYFENGRPAKFWSFDDDGKRSAPCEYRDGNLVTGSAKDCPQARSLGRRSVAPGCVARMIAAQQPVPGCEYD
jgi:hypothetical protein